MTCDRSSSCAFGTISEVEHLGMHKQEAEAKCRKATALATETALDFRCFRILSPVCVGGAGGGREMHAPELFAFSSWED